MKKIAIAIGLLSLVACQNKEKFVTKMHWRNAVWSTKIDSSFLYIHSQNGYDIYSRKTERLCLGTVSLDSVCYYFFDSVLIRVCCFYSPGRFINDTLSTALAKKNKIGIYFCHLYGQKYDISLLQQANRKNRLTDENPDDLIWFEGEKKASNDYEVSLSYDRFVYINHIAMDNLFHEITLHEIKKIKAKENYIVNELNSCGLN